MLISTVTFLLSAGTIIAQLLALLFLFSLLLKKEEIKEKRGLGTFIVWVSDHVLTLGFVVSAGAVLSSLFYSSIAGYAPCELCWWQRICIYPQAVLFAVALYYRKKGIPDLIATTTSLILSVVGAGLALFQYYGATFNPSLLEACVAVGPSCAKNYFTSFGYITIPLMSLTCFILLILMVVLHKRVRHILK